MNVNPIGIIDSGVGGLSIWREIVKVVPDVSTIYIADTKNCPYGSKTESEIYDLSERLIRFMMEKNIRIIVVACNTISVVALEKLRAKFPELTIVGTVPAVKVAAGVTKNQKIGILSTMSTAQSRYLSQLITKFANHHRVIVVGSQKLVPYVEQGITSGEGLRKVLESELSLFQKEEIDTLVLGCSHFPFLKETIQSIYSFENIIDSAGAISTQVKSILKIKKNYHTDQKNITHTLYTTGNAKEFSDTALTLLGGSDYPTINKIEHLNL